jgi:hypothetical protein
LIPRNQTPTNAGLVADGHDPKPCLLQAPEPLSDAGQEPNLLRVIEITLLLDERPVAI